VSDEGPVAHAAAVIAQRGGVRPRVGVVLGSGLGVVAEAVTEPTIIDYAELPGFPRPTVAGHGGTAVLGQIGDVPVAVLQGRAHVYEGGDLDAIRTPIRALRAAGAEILVLTNAAGSLRPELGPGRLMMITDHINLSGVNVLSGPNDESIGPRFPSLRDAYDPELCARLRAAAEELGTELAEGVYLAVSGPTFETPAEIRAFERLGADAVGMSTVLEAIVAHWAGAEVVGVSLVTNPGAGITGEPLSHEEVLAAAAEAGARFQGLIRNFVRRLAAA
jgi:xanthosine phosphorylase